ncbi:hypothetical protein G6F58_013799 [Rhizopus delemar]|nr:hypothetical protein G6F58_013799 [Rhizopus delemar]
MHPASFHGPRHARRLSHTSIAAGTSSDGPSISTSNAEPTSCHPIHAASQMTGSAARPPASSSHHHTARTCSPARPCSR